LFREHADALRDRTNELFTSLKELRGKLDEEFERLSKENFERFNQMLTDVEKKVSDGLRLQPLFDDLKEMQRKFREAKLTKDHRTKIWDRLDLAFKVIKDKRFGTSANAPASGTANDGAPGDDRSPGERLNRRYEGLMSAIDKMEKSIKRDEDDLDFQKRKVANTDGQLEAQIRQAKILMIEERIRSKREKLGEMLQTREELDRRVETQKERDAKKAEQDKILEAKRAAEEKIKSEIKAAADARKDDDGKLSKAAEQLKVEKGASPKTTETPVAEAEDSLLDAVVNTVSDSVTDVVDTLKAVGIVIGDKIGDLVEDIKEAMETPAAEPEAPSTETENVVEVEVPTAEVEPTIEEPVVEETKEDSEKTEDPEPKDPNE
jgi:chromosome segregation ATPase